MNVICSPVAYHSLPAKYSSNGVSKEAEALASIERESEAQASLSFTLNQPGLQTQQALYEAVLEAAVDNWDGYGAKAVGGIAFSAAIRFSSNLPVFVPPPEIDAEPNGRLIFQWHKSPQESFSVIPTSDDEVIYAGLFGTGNVHGTEYYGDELPQAILGNLQRLFS